MKPDLEMFNVWKSMQREPEFKDDEFCFNLAELSYNIGKRMSKEGATIKELDIFYDRFKNEVQNLMGKNKLKDKFGEFAESEENDAN